LLDAKVAAGDKNLDYRFKYGWASDLMSDTLAFMPDGSILLTGLVNDQVVRTADMVDCRAVILVRGKRPSPEMVETAEAMDICLLTTNHSMYSASGILYQAGLAPVVIKRDKVE